MVFPLVHIWASFLSNFTGPEPEEVVVEEKPVLPPHRFINAAGLAILKQYEGFKAKPYICPAGVPTIGYGCTYYSSGKRVTLNDPAITEVEASALLREILVSFEAAVTREVKTVMTENEFSALVCLVYNIGVGNFTGVKTGKPSTVLMKLNANDKAGAAAAFGMWVKAGGKVLPGLVKRRESEKQLFLTV